MVKVLYLIATTCLYFMLSLFSIHSKAQETVQKELGHSHTQNAFSDKDAVTKMAKNFESAERDAMQQPYKVIQYLGNIKGKKIMDIGAATGYFSVKLAANGADVIAADVSEELQAYLKNRMEKEKIRNMELRKVPYDSPLLKDKEVDIVFIANTYHHIDNRTEYFAKVKKGLKPDGKLVILDFFKAEFTDKIQAPPMGMRVSVDEVVFELRKAGFTSFEVEVKLLPYQYIIKVK
ncbi:methyltransferase family protein [Chryseobacterium sp. 52]|uniref:class I SAM-dependent methyltransferase n=1 Tax=Chryseobacterium sp. 52 TaxID=2035213 RepID=UPI000C18B09C|nr:class I SAM-dependent methyltransferase [Chryseobacterium sp. 52]PIF46288.1 methyltransferase family protein [Chryseobacterium sp. 52]